MPDTLTRDRARWVAAACAVWALVYGYVSLGLRWERDVHQILGVVGLGLGVAWLASAQLVGRPARIDRAAILRASFVLASFLLPAATAGYFHWRLWWVLVPAWGATLLTALSGGRRFVASALLLVAGTESLAAVPLVSLLHGFWRNPMMVGHELAGLHVDTAPFRLGASVVLIVAAALAGRRPGARGSERSLLASSGVVGVGLLLSSLQDWHVAEMCRDWFRPPPHLALHATLATVLSTMTSVVAVAALTRGLLGAHGGMASSLGSRNAWRWLVAPLTLLACVTLLSDPARNHSMAAAPMEGLQLPADARLEDRASPHPLAFDQPAHQFVLDRANRSYAMTLGGIEPLDVHGGRPLRAERATAVVFIDARADAAAATRLLMFLEGHLRVDYAVTTGADVPTSAAARWSYVRALGQAVGTRPIAYVATGGPCTLRHPGYAGEAWGEIERRATSVGCERLGVPSSGSAEGIRADRATLSTPTVPALRPKVARPPMPPLHAVVGGGLGAALGILWVLLGLALDTRRTWLRTRDRAPHPRRTLASYRRRPTSRLEPPSKRHLLEALKARVALVLASVAPAIGIVAATALGVAIALVTAR